MADRFVKVLEQSLRYEPETGKLFWRERPADHFVNDRIWKAWNAKWAGKEAFTANSGVGYKVGAINSKLMRAHRVIWALAYGKFPEGQIDHINGIKTDNRLQNLRDVSHATNAKNQKLRSTNTSGLVGVAWVPRLKKWRAQITVDGAARHLGMFETREQAIEARQKADKANGFHANHGRLAA